MMRNNNAIVLCSGGLDSVVSAYYAKKTLNYNRIIILFFDYGQRSLEQERKFSKKCSKNLKALFIEIKLNNFDFKNHSLINKKIKIKKIKKNDLKNTKKESEKFYFPFRNSIFLSYAMSLAETLFIKNKKIYDIFVGFKCEGKESYPDTTKDFVNLVNKIISLHKFNGKLFAPLIKKDKDEIILLGNKLNVDFAKTYSCYAGVNGDKIHCGICLACRLRQEAFYWANINDPTKYKEKMRDFRTA